MRAARPKRFQPRGGPSPLASTLIAALAALAACGGSGDPGEEATLDASSSSTEVAAASKASTTPNVPYRLPVVLPDPVRSPRVDPRAPYTPTVKKLLEQLLPSGAAWTALSDADRLAKLQNAVELLTGGTNSTCYGVGHNGAPSGTSPVIMPMCWADAAGIKWNASSDIENTTSPMEGIGLAASFNLKAANAWGQVEAREGRQLMMTGLLGPQADLAVFPNWFRNVNSSTGEDPFLGARMAAAQIHGLQGQGLMSQMKHFGPYNGTDESRVATLQDQALREMVLAAFEGGVVDAAPAAVMATYQPFKVDTTYAKGADYLSGVISSLTAPSNYVLKTDVPPVTWALSAGAWAAENPYLLTYLLRNEWGMRGFVGPDYGGNHSTHAILQGQDMEPSSDFLGKNDPSGSRGVDVYGHTCADASGYALDCAAPGAVKVAGIPWPSDGTVNLCGQYGCGLANAVHHGLLPMSVLKQSLARMLYQEERFGMLGCDNATTDPSSCKNPGGVKLADGSLDRTGTAGLPVGAENTARPVLGTKWGDAAVVEKMAEEGAVLLKNDGKALPITAADLSRGVSVAGGNAEYLIPHPFNESALGYKDRTAIGPLLQLKALSGKPAAFSYSPVNDATGRPVPASAFSTSDTSTSGSLALTVNGAAAEPQAKPIDFTAASGNGQLAAGTYSWTGYVYVPSADSYTFRFQYTDGATVGFSIDGTAKAMASATSFYRGYYYGFQTINVSPTVGGYTEAGLLNKEAGAAGGGGGGGGPGGPGGSASNALSLAAGYHPVTITLTATQAVSFRFAWSRAQGDIDDAAADASGKALALVFVNDDQVKTVAGGGPGGIVDYTRTIADLPDRQVKLIQAVAAVNPRTVVVMNTGAIVNVPWADEVEGILEMWNAGQEGGTATARLLLGQVSPSGHTPITWPKLGTDTLYGTSEPADGLYPGSAAGEHHERLPGAAEANETQGIFSGYRYYDKLDIPVRFPFGHGLTYTTFEYSNLRLTPTRDDEVTVSFLVKNTGKVKASAVPQVYVGPARSVPTHVQQAERALRGFDRVELDPRESRWVSITLDARSFEYWDTARQSWETGEGTRKFWVGEGLGDLRLSGSANPQGGCRGHGHRHGR